MWLVLLALACKDSKPDLEALTAQVITEPITTLEAGSVGAMGDFAPVYPGQLTPPEGFGDAEGLRPLLVGPQGEAESPGQAVVVFDRPMVALTALNTAPVPLSCAPGAGRARWAGSSTAVWVPEGGSFPHASEFSCTVPKGTAALDGSTLDRALSFSFATARPEVLRARFTPSSDEVDPGKPILLVFNQDVDPDKVAAAINLRPKDGGRALTVTGQRPKDSEDSRLPKDLSRAVELLAPMAKDTEYVLKVDHTLRGIQGPRGMAEDWSVSFHTVPPARLAEFSPQGQAVDPYAHLHLGFTTTFAGEELNSKISISPAPPDGFEPAQDYSARSWNHSLRLEPMTTYTVTLAPGAKDEHGQVLDKGATWSFTTGHYDPMLHAPTGFQLYPANNPPSLPLRSRNASALYARVVPVTETWVMENGLGWGLEGGVPDDEVIELFSGAELDDKIRIDQLDLSPYLFEGRGLLLVETWSPQVLDWQNKTVMHRALLQVTDLGASLQLGPEGLNVWVTRLSDGAPVEGAEVQVFIGEDAPKALWTGRSDKDGLAQGALALPDDWSAYSSDKQLVAVVRLGADRVVTRLGGPNSMPLWRFGVWSSESRPEAAELRVHAFSDRGVYRPGETAHVAYSARLADKGGLSSPSADSTTRWSCDDARGAPLAKGEDRLSSHGGGSFDLLLPADMAYGTASCSIRVMSGEYEGSASVSVPVHAYRAPSFRVDVTPPAQGMVGEELKFVGSGAYLFGAAMKGADVKWTATADASSPNISGWEDWSFQPQPGGGWWNEEESGFEQLGAGDAVLDKDGRFTVPLTLKPREDGRAWSVRVEMTVADPSRQRISNRAELMVHPADFYLGMQSSSSVGQAGKETTVKLAAVDPKGQTRSGVAVDIAVVRRTWDTVRQKDMDGTWTWVSNPKDEPVLERKLSTQGEPVDLTFTPDTGGYYVVRARALDAKGRVSLSEEGVWVAGQDASWARGEDNSVSLQPDKIEYKPGDVAHILVKAPKAGLWGLVSLEREGVLSRKVMRFDSVAQTIDVPLAADAVPNVYVSVQLVEGAPPVTSPRGGIPDWYLGYVNLKVSPEGRRLAVDLKTDRDTYQPGETVDVKVKVQTAGVPKADAHVVLYAVDYGVLSLTDYQLPDPFTRYFEQHGLSVILADSRTRILNRAEYLVKGAAAGGGGAAGEGFVRNKFVTTPYWNPNLTTDKNGELNVKFELPHNLTTFQIMAVVDGGADSFGGASRQVQVSRPLIARPALPRLLRVGDKALAGIVVHNNRDEEREVSVVAEAQGVTLKGSPLKVTVPANGAVEVPFALTDPQFGKIHFKFDVQAGQDRDTVEVDLDVVRPQPAETVATAGLAQGLAKEQIELPAGLLAGVGGLDLRLSSTVLVGLDDSLGYLVEYPHGCVEQTASRVLALMLVRDLGPRAGATLPSATIDQYITEGLAKISTFRHASGGYSYWAGSEPSALATAYVAELHTLAKQPVPDDTVNFLRAVLAGRYIPTYWSPEATLTAQARVALTLARIGKGDTGFNARLYAARSKLSLNARAELLETIARTTGKDKRTADLLRELETHLYVEADQAVVQDKAEGRWTALWDGDDLPTATTLLAVLALDPSYALAPRLARGLVHTRSHGYWSNTYVTARSLQALSAYVKVYEQDSAAKATISLAGKQLLNATLDAKTLTAQASIPIDQVQTGELTVQGDGRVYYEARLSYAMAAMPPRDEGFTLTRSYHIIEGGGAAGQVTPGALVQVTLTVTTPIDRSGVAVVDPLPAGLEPVDSFFATTASALGEDEDSGYSYDTAGEGYLQGPRLWSDWVFNHRELRDDGVYLYADWMPAGVHVYSWYARATTPGEYSLPAATVEEMYRPEIFGRTEAARFVVGASPVAKAE